MSSATRGTLARAPLAMGGLGIAWMVLAWAPASTGEVWPARAGDLLHAVPAVGAVALATLVAALLASRTSSLLGFALSAVVVTATLLGWPVLGGDLPQVVAGEPWHALAALIAALVGVIYVRDRTPASALLTRVGVVAAVLVFALAAITAARIDDDLPPMGGEAVVLALLDEERLRTVVRENKRHPVRVASFAAHDVTQFDAGTLPVLEMTPPAEVRIRIPPSSPGTVLRLAAGISADSYRSEERTRVHLEAYLDGEQELHAQLSTKKDVIAKRRTWHRGEIDVAGGGTLVLRSRFEGPANERPRAGFGLLEVVQPVPGTRTLASRRRPNAILVVVDTLRADRLSVYGNPRPTSPELDALARRGAIFEAAFSSASWTWPSTASVLTSLTPPEHGVLDQAACYLSESLVTVAEVFQGAGFTTTAFSSNPLVSADKNFDKGFESFHEYHWDVAADVIADAETWVREKGGHRFFMYLHLVDPHGPYEPDPDLALEFGRPAPPDFSEEDHSRLVGRLRRSEAVDMRELERNNAYLSSLYDGEVATVDRALGGFLDALDRMGLLDRTVVAVTSDHGEEFLEHGMMGHGRQIYAESVHVPLILAGPGVPRGVRIDTPVENRFLAPTLLELCGVEPRRNLAGRPNLLDPEDVSARASEPIFFASDLGWWPGHGARALRGVRTSDRLLISSPARSDDGVGLALLFDLDLDPGAMEDLARERPEEVAELDGLVQGWLDRSAKVRPTVFDGGDEARAMLEDLGYIDD